MVGGIEGRVLTCGDARPLLNPGGSCLPNLLRSLFSFFIVAGVSTQPSVLAACSELLRST